MMKAPNLLAICGSALVVAVFGLLSMGQEPAKKATPRGRLPAYYKDLVSPDQRDEIYAIQGKYNAEIKELEAKIEKLKKERDTEVERVLTPKQQERLKLLMAAKGKSAATEKPTGDASSQNDENAGKKEVFPK